MSIFNAFRSGGRANKRGYFDFEDEFGQDPIRSRYANTSFADEDSTTRVNLATSEMELAKASLEAMTEPAKKTFEYLNNINQTAKLKDDMMRQSRISARSVQLREQIDSADSYEALQVIVADPNNAESLASPELNGRLTAKESAFKFSGKAALKLGLSKAMSSQEVDNLVTQYSYLVGDPEADKIINTFTPLAQRREAAMKGLQEQGVQAMPVTRSGELDVDRAETALSGGYTKQDISTYQTILRSLNAEKADQAARFVDPESEEAQALESKIKSVQDQLVAAGNQSMRQTAMAQSELRSLGAATPEDQDADIATMFSPGAPLTPRSGTTAGSPVTQTPAESTPRPTPATTDQPPEPESEAEAARKAEEAKVTAQSDRAASDFETLTEERDRLYKRGYKFSPSKEQRETYARVDQAVSDARNEETDARRQRRAEIDARLKEIGQFPNDPQLREEAQALIEEKRRLTGVKIF
jgi:hypothetical protein